MRNSGIAILDIRPIGRVRLDSGGLRPVELSIPLEFSAEVQLQLNEAFRLSSGHHVPTREAATNLHKHLFLKPEDITLIGLTEESFHFEPEEGLS